MRKIALKINKHYGNNNLKIIMENLILMKISNIKTSSKIGDKSYYNVDANSIAIHNGESKV